MTLIRNFMHFVYAFENWHSWTKTTVSIAMLCLWKFKLPLLMTVMAQNDEECLQFQFTADYKVFSRGNVVSEIIPYFGHSLRHLKQYTNMTSSCGTSGIVHILAYPLVGTCRIKKYSERGAEHHLNVPLDKSEEMAIWWDHERKSRKSTNTGQFLSTFFLPLLLFIQSADDLTSDPGIALNNLLNCIL